jgi:hypothetical protein
MRVVSNDGTVAYTLPNNAIISISEYINGQLYASSSDKLGGNGKHNFPVFSSVFPGAQSYPYNYTVTYTVMVDGSAISEASVSVRCVDANSGILVSSSMGAVNGEELVVAAAPPDARFNWGFGDSNLAILYPAGDSMGLYLYAGDLYIPNFVSAEDIATYLDKAPSENTLMATQGAVSVYVLTTGEIQFNIGPDAEGKQYVLIMSNLSGSNVHGYALDPNE